MDYQQTKLREDLIKKYYLIDNDFAVPYIWHYTDINGLTGILRDCPQDKRKIHFWFTQFDCLNDASEGIYTIEMFKRVYEELYENGTIDLKYYNKLKSIDFTIKNAFFYTKNERDYLEPANSFVFICSFSYNDDSLDMWRYYSKENGGYAIKLQSDLFSNRELFSGIICNREYYKVIYDRKKQESLLRGLIVDSISWYKDAQIKKPEDSAASFVKSVLRLYQFLFKHECYSSEKECRCVLYIPKDKMEDAADEQFEVKYRKYNGMIVPYIDFAIDDGERYVKEVKASPFLRNSVSIEIIKEYIKKCGYDHVDVTVSELPVRF